MAMLRTAASRKRSALSLGRFEHALGYSDTVVGALHNTFGIASTWEAVRRVATEVLDFEIKDVGLAWQVIRHERDIAGEEALRARTERAVARWREDLALAGREVGA